MSCDALATQKQGEQRETVLKRVSPRVASSRLETANSDISLMERRLLCVWMGAHGCHGHDHPPERARPGEARH